MFETIEPLQLEGLKVSDIVVLVDANKAAESICLKKVTIYILSSPYQKCLMFWKQKKN